MSYQKVKTLLIFLSFGLFLFGFSNLTESDLEEEKRCGTYDIKVYGEKDGFTGLLKILQSGKEVYSEEDIKFRIGLMYDTMPEDNLVQGCKDITKSGWPNLVISGWSGGAHCCFSFYIFSLGKKFKLIDVIDARHSDLAKFIDVDKDGSLEFIGNDWTFAYWNTSFAGSPAPKVILKYKNGKYRLALDLMNEPLPNPREKEKILKSIQADIEELKQSDKEQLKKEPPFGEPDTGKDTGYFAWLREDVVLPASVWGHMLDLIYTGHPTEAQKFIDEIWPKGQQGKKEFLSDFNGQLSLSPYYQDLRKYYGSDFAVSYSPSLPNKR